MGLYASNGSINVTVVTGSSYVGMYAPDGSMNVTGSDGTGLHHRCGALSVTSSLDGNVLTGRYAPDKSMYINSSGFNNGSQYVTYI